MSSVFPQFGAFDYSGLTTEEEMMRHTFVNGERGSPLIGARISTDQRAQIPAGLPYSYTCRGASASTPASAAPIAPMVPVAPVAPMAPQAPAQKMDSREPISVTEAALQLFNSRPVSAMDWILLIIIFIAVLCFVEYAGEILGPFLRPQHNQESKRVAKD